MGSDLPRRLGVAAIGIPLSALVVYVGGVPFAAGLGLLALIATWELGRMLRTRGHRMVTPLAMAGAAGFPLAVLWFQAPGAWLVTAALVITAAGTAALRVRPAEGPFVATALTVVGALYLGGLLSFGVPLREHLVSGRAQGTLLFFFPVLVTWASDTAAYFGGRRFGRRRLAPVVSPNKTVEGAVAALLAGPIVAVAFGLWILPKLGQLGPGVLLLLGLLVSAAAIVGDLAESALKRECGVKDASNLLPGHGGLLDRLDSLLWTIPIAYLTLRALG
ncbi:MAG: phosphatidate cytidylyltransferase [Gemmatimonadota bacterium]